MDNIFASMGAGDDYNDNPNSNNMFQNFATNNAGITAAAVGGGGSILPYRKYSDCTNQRSRTIPANDISAAVEASSPRANAANQMIRSESGTFSKSVGTSAAFLMRGNRNMSEWCVRVLTVSLYMVWYVYRDSSTYSVNDEHHGTASCPSFVDS